MWLDLLGDSIVTLVVLGWWSILVVGLSRGAFMFFDVPCDFLGFIFGVLAALCFFYVFWGSVGFVLLGSL